MKISVTLLSDYLYCPRKLFLERALKLKEPPKESIIAGSVRHQICDGINKVEKKVVTSIARKEKLEFIQELYKHESLKILRELILKNKKKLNEVNVNLLEFYKANLAYVVEQSLMRASNIFEFTKQNNVFGHELWEKLTPKIISELRIESEKLRLKGVVDAVYAYENFYVPMELKSGSMPRDGVWPSHRIQIAAYSLLLEEKFSKEIKEGIVFYMGSNEKRRISINPFMKDEVKGITDDVVSLLESMDLPDFCDNKNKCAKCGLKQVCYNEEEVSSMLKIKLRNI